MILSQTLCLTARKPLKCFGCRFAPCLHPGSRYPKIISRFLREEQVQGAIWGQIQEISQDFGLFCLFI